MARTMKEYSLKDIYELIAKDCNEDVCNVFLKMATEELGNLNEDAHIIACIIK